MTSPTVSDASPLIALDQIRQLALLQELFTEVWIPPAVTRETAPSVTLPSWIRERSLSQPIGPRLLAASLGAGERETISLALEVTASWVVLDELRARRLAQSLGLNVIGTLGILLAAKRRGLVTTIRPFLDDLLNHDFHIDARLYDRVLMDAGEGT